MASFYKYYFVELFDGPITAKDNYYHPPNLQLDRKKNTSAFHGRSRPEIQIPLDQFLKELPSAHQLHSFGELSKRKRKQSWKIRCRVWSKEN